MAWNGNSILFSFPSASSENDFICDCRLSWLIELKNQTKSEELRVKLDEIECLMKKSKDQFQKTSKILHNAIDRPPQEAEDEPEYYDDEPDGKTYQLTNLKTTTLPCPEETTSDPTELPLSRESIGFDMSWVKVVSSSSSLRFSLCAILLAVCLNILKLCWIINKPTNLTLIWKSRRCESHKTFSYFASNRFNSFICIFLD